MGQMIAMEKIHMFIRLSRQLIDYRFVHVEISIEITLNVSLWLVCSIHISLVSRHIFSTWMLMSYKLEAHNYDNFDIT